MLASGPENIESGAGWMEAGKLGIASAPTILLRNVQVLLIAEQTETAALALR
jgi:hypothetical protein